jgi:hypothetical protein
MMKVIKEKSDRSDMVSILETLLVWVITVYIAYVMIYALAQNDPSFGRYGLPIIGALVVGIIAFLRKG